ncbi:type II CRISPR RNA-guided endonuclease Cas9 [Limosilactobacillus allomucosae]|uniref:type II CRISPR RNA-guided endonuclease Cas9 n=1 Tax=Limosilactobacillus allomucosae TaxID=3142938 RepID=UPI0032651BA5
MTKTKPYNISLDIKENKIGYTLFDDNYNIIKYDHRHAIGVDKFVKGDLAEERRLKRTSRRTASRTKWRLELLNEIFKPYIDKVDPEFFWRKKHSYASQKDPKFSGKYIGLFENKDAVKAYTTKYPTIYHLRYALMHENHRFDIREVYLGIAHIIKHRGNFLNSTPMSSFSSQNSKFNFQAMLTTLNSLYASVETTSSIDFNDSMAVADEFESLLLSTILKRKEIKDKSIELLTPDTNNKAVVKMDKAVIQELCNAILGNEFNPDKLLQLETSADTKISFEAEDYDAKRSDLDLLLTQEQQSIIDLLGEAYNYVALSKLIPSGKTISEVKIESYNLYRKQLSVFKGFWKSLPADEWESLKQAYIAYAGFKDSENPVKAIDQEEFYDKVARILKRHWNESNENQLTSLQSTAKQIQTWINQNTFLVKQRSKENQVIPYQVQQFELDKIIENQKNYYPFLAEENPVKKHIQQQKYKIDELVAFRIPYYVGPMVDNSLKGNSNPFAWMVRNENKTGRITPWNFEQEVNVSQSANNFIRRMTAQDTYLKREDVLPASSLLYQKYTVLNELNTIQLDGVKRLTVTQKQYLFNKLFKQNKSVTVKSVQKEFVNHFGFAKEPTITGLSNPKKFTSSLSTYIDFKKIVGEKVDDTKYQDDLEKIVEWSTIFREGDYYSKQLATIDWLTPRQRKQLAQLHFKSWGRFSKRLLTKIYDGQGNSVLDIMWHTNKNFMQIISTQEFSEQLDSLNESYLQSQTLDDILNRAYANPANKKAIRQSLYLLDDLTKCMGHAPAKIILTFERKQEESAVAKQRKKTLQGLYDNVPDDFAKKNKKQLTLLKKELANCKEITDKQYLYFQQFGLDLYSGKPLDFDNLSQLKVVKILKPTFIHDNSINNKVLVSTSSANLSLEKIRMTQRPLWDLLSHIGLLPGIKMRHLLLDQDTDKIGDKLKENFTNKYLTSKGQISKLLAAILNDRYRNTAIITVRAEMQNQLRTAWHMPRESRLNEYWIAEDAFLSGIAGQFLYSNYPKLRPFFTYGLYQRDINLRDLRSFNFLYKLLRNDEKNQSDDAISESELQKIQHIKKMASIVYRKKTMNVTMQPFEFTENLYKETRFSHTVAKPTFARLKKDLPVEIYGGYSNNQMAFMSIIKFSPKDKPAYLKVFGIRRVYSDHINQLLKKGSLQEADEAILDAIQVYLTKKEEKMPKNVAIRKVLFNQLVDDGSRRFRLASYKYLRSVAELTLSDESRTLLSKINGTKLSTEEEQDADSKMINLYDDILSAIRRSFSLYTYESPSSRNGAMLERLREYRSEFEQLPFRSKAKISGKVETINDLLEGLYPDARMVTLKDSKGKPIIKNLGMFTENGIKLPVGTKLFDISPSGLLVRYVVVK